MTARNFAALSLLLTAALGSWYLAGTLQQEPAATDTTPRAQKGYYLRNARILGTGDAGELLYEIVADYAEQQAGDTIAFDNVRVRYSPEADVPWSVSADQALITGQQQRLTLSGHVLAVSNRGFSGQVTEIRTDWLELEPDNFLAHTDRRVQIRIGERSLTATGMEAALRDNRLALKSNVSGKFVP